jgi:hypothetical protein
MHEVVSVRSFKNGVSVAKWLRTIDVEEFVDCGVGAVF